MSRPETKQDMSASECVLREAKGNRKWLEYSSEEEVKLVHRVFLTEHSELPRVVVFSGVGHGDGSTTVCVRAARVIADQVKGSVCVVDANLRSPALHHHFGTTNKTGFMTALKRPDRLGQCVIQCDPQLWFLPSGAKDTSIDPTTVTVDRVAAIVRHLRDRFDRVLFDTPPSGIYADAARLGEFADGMVLVVRANRTRREAARRAKEDLEAVNVRILGAVLNARTFPIPSFIYRRL